MRRVAGGSGLVVAIALAGCGDGPRGLAAPADDAAPVDSATAAAPASALDAEQAAWLDAVAAEGLDALALEGAGDPGADLDHAATHGPRAPRLEEPTRPIRRETPRALLASALEALAAADVAALARLSRARDERPTLDEDDALDAERRFLAPAVQPYWRRVAAAARLGDVSLEPGPSPDEARLRVVVGGALGSYVIHVRRRGDGWYLAG